MAIDRIRIIASVGLTDKAMLDRFAREGMYSRAKMVGDILTQFLRDPHNRRALKAGLAARLAVDIADLPKASQATAAERRAIVDRWVKVLTWGKRRGRAEHEVTSELIESIRRETGERISRATLYNWRRRYSIAGIAGLSDGRSLKGISTRIQRSIKPGK